MSDATLQQMLSELGEAVEHCDCSRTTCDAVKDVLERHCKPGASFLPDGFLDTCEGGYARRLLHHDPERNYSVIVMVWGSGQGTPIHDHAGMWCVECVYTGRIQVDSYDVEDEAGEILRFAHQECIGAGCGEAGTLIPPYDYHTIRNPHEVKAATIHVYGGYMDWCNIFEALEDGSYRKVRRELGFA